MSYYYVDNYFRQFWSIKSDFDWFIIYYFGQAVDNNKNWVIAIVFPVGG